MAILPIKEPEPGAPAAHSGKGLMRAFWAVIIIGLMMVISLPTVLLVFFGLLPTIVAWIIDRSEQKYATFCVGGMNLSGIFPFLSDIWFDNHSVDAAVGKLTDVFDLMVMYGSAGFGWMLYVAVPPVVTTFLSVMSQRRVTVLKTNQANIVEEWGEAVTNVVESVVDQALGGTPPDAEER